MLDYLIVGSGFYGSIFAYEMHKRGYSVKVIEKREHVGGNAYNEKINDINVHKYGAHIFHTNDKKIWEYINQFCEFNRFTNSPMANYKGEYYNLPFNMNTFHQMWKVTKPEEAKSIIAKQIAESNTAEPSNLEEQAISLVGKDIYYKLIKGYTEKQWGRKATELPAFIIKRLPVRFTFDNNYFNDFYQGIPVGGYNAIFDKLLDGIEVELNCDFFSSQEYYENCAKKIIYTGPIDKFFDYKFGMLEYRSLRFEHKLLEEENFQGNAVVNYTDSETPYTRVIEHKHFEFGQQPSTVITYEYPADYNKDNEAYYPVNDSRNNAIYAKYKSLAKDKKQYIFGGRLGEYKYYDMHQVIALALKAVDKELATIASI